MHFFRLLLCLTASFAFGVAAFAITVEPLPLDERVEMSGAICRGTVESVGSYRGADGFIYTDVDVHVAETFKGHFGERFTLTFRGGEVSDGGETVVGAPQLNPGDERLFFLARGKSDSIHLVSGPEGALLVRSAKEKLERVRKRFPHPAAGMTVEESPAKTKSDGDQQVTASVQAASSTEGLSPPPRRFTRPDRGEPIRYVVDADFLPDGMSLSDALLAVENAFDAWTEDTSLQFQFDGVASFNAPANDLNFGDRRLYLQLHNDYGVIPEGGVLGIGGQAYEWVNDFRDGGTGGRVNEVEFHVSTEGFVILRHTAASLENFDTFEAVLGHEIGHALGLMHSSEDPDESDAELSEALMYFAIHTDGRGASLAPWDVAAIQRIHPVNPPPFGFERVIRAVTSNNPLANPHVNHVELRGYSLHDPSVDAELYHATDTNGTFSLDDSTVAFLPDAAFSDSEELDPGGSSYWDFTYVRFSDGTHLSPPVEVRVIQFLLDTRPASAPDGMPDSWMEDTFGSISPTAGVSGADDDPDGDGLTNLQEFLAGTDPLDMNSRLAISAVSPAELSWQARPYEVYEIERSENLVDWDWHRTVRPESETGVLEEPSLEGPKGFFRVKRVN